MPLISVIIPVYNGKKTIATTINSVIEQTFTDWELIIINDGSQDNTLEIIQSISDLRIKVFSYPNAGLANSRNRGISQAQGEFIAFLDADDLWTKDKLEKQLVALQAHPQASVAYSWTDYIDNVGQFLYPGSHTTINGDAYPRLLVNNFLESGSNPLIRHQALEEVGGFDSSINSTADWDMYLRLAAKYEFIAVPDVQVFYRISSDSMSAGIVNMEAQSRTVIERGFNQAPASLQYLKKRSLSKLYEYLIYRSLSGNPQRGHFFQAAYYLWQVISHEPNVLWRRTRLISILLLKIVAGIVSPILVMKRSF